MQPVAAKWLLLCLIATSLHLSGQQRRSPPSPGISVTDLPKARLWERYFFQLQASGGSGPYDWHLVAGNLPRSLLLNANGFLAGVVDRPGPFNFTVVVKDDSRPPKEETQKLLLNTEAPLIASWDQKAHVSGSRIDGSIKLSNQTGRDFDLTFIVLAVNDIGRATAVGYQHFLLKKDTRDMQLPFGETLSPGNYVTNVDVVGEEPISKQIFRARLVSGKESITPSP